METKKKVLLGVMVAREILTGDVHAARLLAGTQRHWSVPEAQAICGACMVARSKWDASVSFSQFIGFSG